MKNFTLITAALLLLFLPNIKAQEVAPLQLGNIWVYSGPIKITVVDTNVIVDTISYFKLRYQTSNGQLDFNSYVRLKEGGYYAIRRDSTYPAPNHEKIYWKKNAVIGDTWENPAPDFPLIYTVIDTFVTSVFGVTATIKHLEIDGSLVLFNEYWAEKFGKLSRSDFHGPITSLQGCVINGVAYGDTTFTLVSVDNELNPPHDFILEQNYPNPFNSSTIISFNLQERDYVVLEIFNLLGEKVKTLINEFKPAGTHTILFEADRLVSGSYFYVLRTQNFTQTKKMIVLK